MLQSSGQEHSFSALRGVKAERRNLTVVFCDMVGSPSYLTGSIPRICAISCAGFRNALKSQSSDLMAVSAATWVTALLADFGFPAAHEDSAERAVHAALEAIRLVSELSFEGVARIEVRIGIATGLVLVGDLVGEGSSREFALIGDAPNLAARLQQLAKPNQILGGPSTRRLLGDLFEFEDLGDQDIKGFSAPITVSGIRRRGTASRFEARRSSHMAPLIGRDAELAVLHGVFEKAKAGQGQFVAVSGEPGIGKSRSSTASGIRWTPAAVACFHFSVHRTTAAARGTPSFVISMTYWVAPTRPVERPSCKNSRH